MSYIIHVDSNSFELSENSSKKLDISATAENHFHVIQDNQNFEVWIEDFSTQNKTALVFVNGEKFTVQIEDEYDQLVKKMGLNIGGNKKLKNIKAPMPGLVLDIMVEKGQEIKKGDQLLILEAMKMENVLKAAGDGIIKSIEVEKGAAVDKNQILIELE